MTEKAIIPIVVPPLSIPEVLNHFNKIQELKRSLIDRKTDVIQIAGKPYILKSGWRKLAFAFNLNDEIIREEKEATPDGETIWRMWVKVTAPNGREVVAVAAASTAEREFAHEEHDPYAMCHTRAKNRAISDILGLGEVSAEEITEKRQKLPIPIEPTIPKFDPLELIQHKWKGKKLIDGSYGEGSLSWGWDFPQEFSFSAIEVLRKGPSEIDEYIFTYDQERNIVHTRKVKKDER